MNIPGQTVESEVDFVLKSASNETGVEENSWQVITCRQFNASNNTLGSYGATLAMRRLFFEGKASALPLLMKNSVN